VRVSAILIHIALPWPDHRIAHCKIPSVIITLICRRCLWPGRFSAEFGSSEFGAKTLAWWSCACGIPAARDRAIGWCWKLDDGQSIGVGSSAAFKWMVLF
jgi:hypothetical protein